MTLSHYALIIHDSPITPDVLRFRGTESLSRPFSWHIEFTTPQKVREEEALLKYARFDMQGRKRVHGVITGFKRLSANPDRSHYGITLESRLSLLSRSRRCALYQRLSVPEVVEQVLRSHGLEGPDFDFMLKRAYPARELITQWQETDLQFIQRILAEVGIWFRQTMNDTTELNIILFADSPLYYVFDGVLPYRELSGLVEDEHCCWGVRTWHNAVLAKVASRGYNHQSAEPMDAVAAVRSDAATIGTEAPYGRLERRAGDEIMRKPKAALSMRGFAMNVC
ncbi:contractile injection system protein, VgrG/Pvc8 family [Pantoea sp.]|uniref:contractile injection system protein, VgrG/Pvc8 family n=1 Tax=Pantoea sp. TaxID=69393 RepID=UPI002899EF78|nr:contractile injection system protein, VgrG/Pvc8 family [Pantoea sp.]